MSQQINLFNPAFLTQKNYFSTVAMLQGLGLILLGSVFFYGYAQHKVAQMRQQSAETAKRYGEEQAKLAQYLAEYSPQQANQLLDDELKRTAAQLAVQQELIKNLNSGALGNTSGYSEYLRAFARQSTSGLWLTGFSISGDGSTMSLSGGVLDPAQVPAYIRRLNREKIMQGKSFAALQMRQPQVDAEKPRAGRYVEFVLQSLSPDEAAK